MSSPESQPTSFFQRLTAPGPAAIAVVRMCGPAVSLFVRDRLCLRRELAAATHPPGSVVRGRLLDETREPIDEILLSVHAVEPAWDIRLHLHGSPFLVRRCEELLCAAGFRSAPPAEADLWQADDLITSEAYALLAEMPTERGCCWLLGQVARLRNTLGELGVQSSFDAARAECREIAARIYRVGWFTTPLRVALVGPPNSGKSTLANALADHPVSLVSPQAGTTRDWVEVPGEAAGYPLTWLDTAGLRSTADSIESEGVARTLRLMEQVDAVVIVLDRSAPAAVNQEALRLCGASSADTALIAWNKSDIGGSAGDGLSIDLTGVEVSAVNRTGLDELADRLLEKVGRSGEALDSATAFTARQAALLEGAAGAADRERFRAGLAACLGPA